MQVKFTLEDTIEWMKSDDYKVRFKAEYWQLVIRMEKARNAIVKFGFDNINGKDIWLVEQLNKQFEIMHEYKKILENRAIGSGIDLDNDSVVLW